jgi:hypothetical protein
MLRLVTCRVGLSCGGVVADGLPSHRQQPHGWLPCVPLAPSRIQQQTEEWQLVAVCLP